MDFQVRASQKWLNDTYAAVAGWVPLDEDGITGWGTMYGLRQALQAELGISPLSSGFGEVTTAQFIAQIGAFDSGTTAPRMLGILSAALWCKGYAGSYSPEDAIFDDLADSVRRLREDLGLPAEPARLDVKLVASLMSMDAYTKLAVGSGSVRTVQQWLNRTYLHRKDFAVVPCDGVYSRQTQKSLLYALQYEIGMADGVANGNFGPGTKSGIQSSAILAPDATDTSQRFVRLLQAALIFNHFETGFDGVHGASSQATLMGFQNFMELTESGTADYGSWCALLVAAGDTDRATRGCDTRTQLTRVDLAQLKANGYEVVGRYLVGPGKFITPDEIAAFRAEDVQLVPIHQRFNNDISYMTAANGTTHAHEAVSRARLLGLPDGSTIYFVVDFDAVDSAIMAIRGYFQAVRDYFNSLRTVQYKIGVYASRNVCSRLIAFGVADDAYVAGMSNGYSGNLGFRMPNGWAYNQIVETTTPGEAGPLRIDKVVVSKRATPVRVSAIDVPGREYDGTPTDTGFDDLLRWVTEVEVEIETTNDPISAPSLDLGRTIPNALRKHKYDSDWWKTYLAPAQPTDPAGVESRAQAAAEAAIATLGRPPSRRDAVHFAAAYMGYLTWGAPSAQDGYSLGDLGGWVLDLLQAFGSWERYGGPVDLDQFLRGNLGVDNESANTVGLGYRAVLADADAFLCGTRPRGTLWSENLRGGLGQSSPADRIRRFGQLRLGMSVATTRSVLAQVYDGLDALGADIGLTRSAILTMAAASRTPTTAETEVIAANFVDCLARLS